MPRREQDDYFERVVKEANKQADNFRLERILIIVFVGVALMTMLIMAVFSLLAHPPQWEVAKGMLIGSGTVVSCATTGFGYMYNRKLRFIETMTARSGS